MFKSLMWKFVYGFIATVLGVAVNFVNANTDIQSWTIAGFIGGLGVAVIAFVKKFALNAFLNPDQ